MLDDKRCDDNSKKDMPQVVLLACKVLDRDFR